MASLNEQETLSVQMVSDLVENLADGQVLRHVGFVGCSMRPMLRQRIDSVELIKAPERLEKYDLPMYMGPRGKYVMHRIVAVEDDCYICRGDNTYALERVRRDQIVALVCAFYRGKKRIEVSAWHYRLYSRLWNWIFPLRKAIRNLKNWLRRHLK